MLHREIQFGSLAQICRVGPSFPFRGVPYTNQNPPFKTAEYGSKLSMDSDPKRLRQFALLSKSACQTRFACVIAASSDDTVAVATSNGGHGFVVEADAAEAKQTSNARSVFFMTSRI